MPNYQGTIRKFEKNYEKKSSRTLKDLQSYFRDKKEVQKILKKKNPVIYSVFIKELSPIDLGLTVINPGNISGEYFFTKGHMHKKKTPEFYILLEGKGELLIQKGKLKVIDLKKGEIALILKKYAHRLINTGSKKLKVLTIYDQKSKPDYKIKFKKRFFKK